MNVAVETFLRGVPISHGVSIGRLVHFEHDENPIVETKITKEDVELEVMRYEQALMRSKQDIKRLKAQFEVENLTEAAAILETHLEILEDPLLTVEIISEIRKQNKNADSVFSEALMQYKRRFDGIKDPFFRERGRDLLDISRRVLGHLRHDVRRTFSHLQQGCIVYSKELLASDVAEASPEHVKALITDVGGVASHAAIVAKAKGIPYIANINFEEIKEALGEEVIVDGRSGDVILFPTTKTRDSYLMVHSQLKAFFVDLESYCKLDTVTTDGYKMRLSANVEMMSEIDLLHRYGGAGVGLFRSEYIFLSKQRFPSEEEQYLIYSKLVEKMQGLPIVIRTFDVGGDKLSVEHQSTHKGNPYLGCRAIRFLLREKAIFKAQLRAILRARLHGPVSLMFPMISDLSELREAKEIIQEAEEELKGKGIYLPGRVRIGCMIEVPSAAMITDLLAAECDFLSIGTNDLVQYLLAVDRCNQAVNKLYNPMHPGLIRMIKLIVLQASKQGVPVSVCGEIAGDPLFTPLLIGLGVNELSVSMRNLPLIKRVIRNTSCLRSDELAREALSLTTPTEISELLHREFLEVMPEEFHQLASR